MNEPTDIKALDEYLKGAGSSDISQHYRELGRDDVPPELDRRVLEEARAAVAGNGAGRSRSWLRWSAPIALAASVVLVVTVVIENGVPKDVAYVAAPATEDSKLYQEPAAVAAPAPAPAPAQEFVPEAPAAAQPAAAPPPPVVAPIPERILAAKKADLADKRERQANTVTEEVRVEEKARRDQVVDAATPVTTVSTMVAPVAPQEAEADSDLSEVAVTGTRARRAVGRTAGPRNTVSAAGLSSDEPRLNKQVSADPEEWLEEIREMRRKGRTAEADSEWQRFSKAYPDFAVAEDDIARKH